jgi:hypothetical protein
VLDATFSHNGKYICTTSKDCTVKVSWITKLTCEVKGHIFSDGYFQLFNWFQLFSSEK